MDESTKAIVSNNAIERAEVRSKLALWQFLPVIDSLSESLQDNADKRHIMLMALLDDIALDAWRLGVRHQQEIDYISANKNG